MAISRAAPWLVNRVDAAGVAVVVLVRDAVEGLGAVGEAAAVGVVAEFVHGCPLALAMAARSADFHIPTVFASGCVGSPPVSVSSS
jgi:hypothetical protein